MKKAKNKMFLLMLRPFKGVIMRYLIKQNIAFDRTDDRSIYFEFYRNVVRQRSSIDDIDPTDPNYATMLASIDWSAIFSSLKSFFSQVVNNAQQKKLDGQTTTDYEAEIERNLALLQQQQQQILNNQQALKQGQNKKINPLVFFGGLAIIYKLKK